MKGCSQISGIRIERQSPERSRAPRAEGQKYQFLRFRMAVVVEKKMSQTMEGGKASARITAKLSLRLPFSIIKSPFFGHVFVDRFRDEWHEWMEHLKGILLIHTSIFLPNFLLPVRNLARGDISLLRSLGAGYFPNGVSPHIPRCKCRQNSCQKKS